MLIVSLIIGGQAGADTNQFPLYPCLETNVAFWTDVYTRYSSTEGILHDEQDLRVIYEIIPLAAEGSQDYQETNRRWIKAAKAKYQAILQRLSRYPQSNDLQALRVANLFGPQASAATFRQAGDHIRCQVGQKDRFYQGLIRSGAYLAQIRHIFKSNGLPQDLAYLPHVESSFDYQAYSKFGAAGIWQFTRDTGRRFLEIGYTLDERRDPIIATQAAALLLKENYDTLGSWPLAITAYNHGKSGMQQAKAKYGDYPTIFQRYNSRTFGFASRNFYSEFLAANQVAQSYTRYFGEIQFAPQRHTTQVTLEGYVALKDVLRYFDINAETLQNLNPAIRPPVFKGLKYLPKGYRLNLPQPKMDSGSLMTGGFPEELYQDHQKASRFYVVQEGDTAGGIARMQGIDLGNLILANNLDAKATIYVNQNLRLPIKGERTEPDGDIQAATQPASPELIPSASQPELASAAPPPFGPLAQDEVQGPEPESRIALPSAKAPLNPGVNNSSYRLEDVRLEDGQPVGTIRVEVEETLGHYANWLNIETQALRRLNGLHFGSSLQIHQTLKIPLARVSRAVFEEKRCEYHKRLQEDFFNAYRIERLTTYRVNRGDTIWTLSNDRFNIPIWLLKQCNPAVDLNDLHLAQRLMIPVVEKSI